MTKFERLIEYVINDDHAKAQELFHDIVVSKSREIYESLMDDECGGDAADDLIDDVETEESGLSLGEAEDEDEADAEFDDEAEEAGEEETKDLEADHDSEEDEVEASDDLEDRVVDLQDQLDELMAEFEELMGGDEEEGEESFDDEVSMSDDGGDALEVDDTETFSDETGMPMSENIDLQKAPAPVTSEPEGTNKKSTTNFNSGARGMDGKPVLSKGDTSNPDGTSAYKQPSNAYSKGEGNLPGAGTFKNVPGKDGSKLAAAPKAVTSQAQGVNNKTPFPGK